LEKKIDVNEAFFATNLLYLFSNNRKICEDRFGKIQEASFDSKGGLFGRFLSNENDFAIMQKNGKKMSQSKNYLINLNFVARKAFML
jgi:hypothetical protein